MHLYLTDNIADFFDSFLLKGMVYGIKNKTSAFSKQPFYLQFFWQPFPFLSFFLTCFLYYLLFTAVFIPATKRFGIHSWPKNSSQVIRQVWICCKWCCGKRDLRNINFIDAIFYSFSLSSLTICQNWTTGSASLQNATCQFCQTERYLLPNWPCSERMMSLSCWTDTLRLRTGQSSQLFLKNAKCPKAVSEISGTIDRVKGTYRLIFRTEWLVLCFVGIWSLKICW